MTDHLGDRLTARRLNGGDTTTHHPTLCATANCGNWATCSCGWGSMTHRTITGAHLAFGEHLTRTEETT